MTPRSLIPIGAIAVAGLMVWLTLRGEEQLAGVVVLGFLTLCYFIWRACQNRKSGDGTIKND